MTFSQRDIFFMRLLVFALVLVAEFASATDCYISLPYCPDRGLPPSQWFRDDFGGASSNPAQCKQRAQDFQNWCGTQVAYTFYFTTPTNYTINTYATTCWNYDPGAAKWVAHADASSAQCFGRGQVYANSSGLAATSSFYVNTGGSAWTLLASETEFPTKRPGFTLMAGQTLSMGSTYFAMQTDGNLVLYTNSGQLLWATSMMPNFNDPGLTAPTYGLNCTSCYAVFQGDGHLVLYNPNYNYNSYHSYWYSRTGGNANAKITVSKFAPYVEIRSVTGVLLWGSSASSNRFVDDLSQTDPMTWLTKSVCVNSSGVVLSNDPYGGCPEGSTIRKIQVGEGLPYFNRDNVQAQWNNFPVRAADGRTFVVNARQFGQGDDFSLTMNFDHIFRSDDQFDIFGVNINNDGWVSILNTRDGGAYNTTFFGPNCAVGGGWKSFPIGSLSSGETLLAIAGVNWQQSGQSFPGACSSVSTGPEQTSWFYIQNYGFGGLNDNPIKPMHTIQSVHGFKNTSDFLSSGHIEVFYFTREYGMTRWETWTPTQQGTAKTNRCAGVPNVVAFKGVNFTVSDCHDNSDALPSNIPILPILPVPNVNVLSYATFGPGSMTEGTANQSWHRTGSSPGGGVINWVPSMSTSSWDMAFGHVGVNYMKTNCNAGPNNVCGYYATPMNYQLIYQDVPRNQFATGSGNYSYGISARVTPGSGASGKMMIGIQQLDAAGNVVWNDSFIKTIGEDNSLHPGSRGVASAFIGSGFYANRVYMPIQASTVKIRFFYSPLTSQTFDVTEAWFAPW